MTRPPISNLQSPTSRLRFHRVWPFLILLAGFALRLYRLGVSSLWYDETVSLYLARQDLVDLTRHTAGDIHPPLYYYLLHFWGQLAGWSEFSAAFLSLFFGVLLIALVFRVARDWLGGRVALVAALLVAISPFNLWYSQEVRMYTLGAALGLVSVYFFVRMLAPTGNRRDWITYAVVSALGMYTLYYFAFLIVFEDLYAIVMLARNAKLETRNSGGWFPISNFEFRISNFQFASWVSSQFAILALYLPWLPIAFRQATDPPVPPWRSFSPIGDVLVESFTALTLGQSVNPVVVAPILVLAAMVLVVGLKRGSGDHIPLENAGLLGRPYMGFFFLAYTFVPLLLIYGLSFWKPLYHVRYMFIYAPGFYLLLALGLVWVYDDGRSKAAEGIASSQRTLLAIAPLRAAFYGIIVLLIAGSAYSAYNFWYDPAYADDDLRGAVQHIDELWRPGDAILIDAGYTYTAFDYYNTLPIAWQGRLRDYAPENVSLLESAGKGPVVLETGSIGGGPSLGWTSPESDFYATTANETRAALDRVFAAHARVWLLRVYDTVVDPDGVVRDYLATHGRIFEDEGFSGGSFARVQGYLTPRAVLSGLPARAVSRRVVLGDRIELLGFAPGTVRLQAGTPLDVDIYWQAKQPTNIDEHLLVGLYAADGKRVVSTEEVPLGNGWGTSRWAPGQVLQDPVRLKIPEGVAAGEYVLRVTLFNPMTHEPLSASGDEWVNAEDQVELTRVTIEK